MVQGKGLSLGRVGAFRGLVYEWDALLSPSVLGVCGGHENLPRGWTILTRERKLCLNLARICLCVGGSWASISQFLQIVCLGGNYCFLYCVNGFPISCGGYRVLTFRVVLWIVELGPGVGTSLL